VFTEESPMWFSNTDLLPPNISSYKTYPQRQKLNRLMCLFLLFNRILNFAANISYLQRDRWKTSALYAHQTMCVECKQTQQHAASTLTCNKTEKYQSNTFPNLTVEWRVKLFIREPRQQQQSNTTVTKSHISMAVPKLLSNQQ
jgi:hypothetical protein